MHDHNPDSPTPRPPNRPTPRLSDSPTAQLPDRRPNSPTAQLPDSLTAQTADDQIAARALQKRFSGLPRSNWWVDSSYLHPFRNLLRYHAAVVPAGHGACDEPGVCMHAHKTASAHQATSRPMFAATTPRHPK